MSDRRGDVLWSLGSLPGLRTGEGNPFGSFSEPSGPRRLGADPEKVERGLAQLVLTLIELLRELMERQALRRVESQTLSPEQEEALGTALWRLSERMDELKDHFELTDEDLNIHLGPLGDLM